MKTHTSIFLGLFLFLALAGGGYWFFNQAQLAQKELEPELSIAVSILPYQSIVQEITGETATVFSIVPEGFSHETYEPSVQEVQKIALADIIIFTGDLPFENQIEQVVTQSNPNAQIVYLTEALSEEDFLEFVEHGHDEEEAEGEETASEDSEHEEEHFHDPHTWLSPRLVSKQVAPILIALEAVAPENMQLYLDNAVVLVAKLEALSEELHTTLNPKWGRSFLVYHPAFGYFADEYGLKQHFIEVEGKEPSAAEVAATIQEVQGESITAVFLESQFATRTAEALAEELGVPVRYVNPLPADYFVGMRELATVFAETL